MTKMIQFWRLLIFAFATAFCSSVGAFAQEDCEFDLLSPKQVYRTVLGRLTAKPGEVVLVSPRTAKRLRREDRLTLALVAVQSGRDAGVVPRVLRNRIKMVLSWRFRRKEDRFLIAKRLSESNVDLFFSFFDRLSVRSAEDRVALLREIPFENEARAQVLQSLSYQVRLRIFHHQIVRMPQEAMKHMKNFRLREQDTWPEVLEQVRKEAHLAEEYLDAIRPESQSRRFELAEVLFSSSVNRHLLGQWLARLGIHSSARRVRLVSEVVLKSTGEVRNLLQPEVLNPQETMMVLNDLIRAYHSTAGLYVARTSEHVPGAFTEKAVLKLARAGRPGVIAVLDQYGFAASYMEKIARAYLKSNPHELLRLSFRSLPEKALDSILESLARMGVPGFDGYFERVHFDSKMSPSRFERIRSARVQSDAPIASRYQAFYRVRQSGSPESRLRSDSKAFPFAEGERALMTERRRRRVAALHFRLDPSSFVQNLEQYSLSEEALSTVFKNRLDEEPNAFAYLEKFSNRSERFQSEMREYALEKYPEQVLLEGGIEGDWDLASRLLTRNPDALVEHFKVFRFPVGKRRFDLLMAMARRSSKRMTEEFGELDLTEAEARKLLLTLIDLQPVESFFKFSWDSVRRSLRVDLFMEMARRVDYMDADSARTLLQRLNLAGTVYMDRLKRFKEEERPDFWFAGLGLYRGQIDEEHADLEQAIETSAESVAQQLGNISFAWGSNLTLEGKVLGRLIEVDAAQVVAHLNLFRNYLERGESSHVYQILEKLVRRHPGDLIHTHLFDHLDVGSELWALFVELYSENHPLYLGHFHSDLVEKGIATYPFLLDVLTTYRAHQKRESIDQLFEHLGLQRRLDMFRIAIAEAVSEESADRYFFEEQGIENWHEVGDWIEETGKELPEALRQELIKNSDLIRQFERREVCFELLRQILIKTVLGHFHVKEGANQAEIFAASLELDSNLLVEVMRSSYQARTDFYQSVYRLERVFPRALEKIQMDSVVLSPKHLRQTTRYLDLAYRQIVMATTDEGRVNARLSIQETLLREVLKEEGALDRYELELKTRLDRSLAKLGYPGYRNKIERLRTMGWHGIKSFEQYVERAVFEREVLDRSVAQIRVMMEVLETSLQGRFKGYKFKGEGGFDSETRFKAAAQLEGLSFTQHREWTKNSWSLKLWRSVDLKVEHQGKVRTMSSEIDALTKLLSERTQNAVLLLDRIPNYRFEAIIEKLAGADQHPVQTFGELNQMLENKFSQEEIFRFALEGLIELLSQERYVEFKRAFQTVRGAARFGVKKEVRAEVVDRLRGMDRLMRQIGALFDLRVPSFEEETILLGGVDHGARFLLNLVDHCGAGSCLAHRLVNLAHVIDANILGIGIYSLKPRYFDSTRDYLRVRDLLSRREKVSVSFDSNRLSGTVTLRGGESIPFQLETPLLGRAFVRLGHDFAGAPGLSLDTFVAGQHPAKDEAKLLVEQIFNDLRQRMGLSSQERKSNLSVPPTRNPHGVHTDFPDYGVHFDYYLI